jgi:hypothetical protein
MANATRAEGSIRREPNEMHEPPTQTEPFRDIDRAAILGAALAAVLSLTLSQGPWDWLSLFIGTTLSALVLFFFRVPADRNAHPRVFSSVWGQLLAHAAVAALCIGLAIAWPLQAAIQAWTPEKQTCLRAAAIDEAAVYTNQDNSVIFDKAAADQRISQALLKKSRDAKRSPKEVLTSEIADEAGKTASGNCAGVAATRWLWLPILIAGASTFAATNKKSLERRMPNGGQADQSQRVADESTPHEEAKPDTTQVDQTSASNLQERTHSSHVDRSHRHDSVGPPKPLHEDQQSEPSDASISVKPENPEMP